MEYEHFTLINRLQKFLTARRKLQNGSRSTGRATPPKLSHLFVDD